MDPAQPPLPSTATAVASEAAHTTHALLPSDQLPLYLAIVLFLVLLNGFFVASEFALVAVRRTRIDQMAAEGSASAAIVQKALGELDRYIAATQVGITVASLLLGGVGERAFEALFSPMLSFLPETGRGITRGAVAFGLAYFVMTALHVVVGELMPKSIALTKSESTSLFIVRPMVIFGKVFAPLIWLLNGTGNFLLRRIGIHSAGEHGSVHSPEELDLLFTQSHEGGELTETERDILHRVVKFSEISARAVMVPRVEMKALPMEMTRQALTDYIHDSPHTRIPVFHGSLDDVIGIAHLKELVKLEAVLREDEVREATVDASKVLSAAPVADTSLTPPANGLINLMPIVREAPRVPETITIDKLLGEFKKRGQQMAIVIDEYGGTAGLVTMGDLLEQAFGDVPDEFNRAAPEVVEQEDGTILLQGRVLIDEVNERYGLGLNSDDADTMAGLVLTALGRPAEVGDEIDVHGARLRVEEIDRLRITGLRMTLPPSSDGTSEASARKSVASA